MDALFENRLIPSVTILTEINAQQYTGPTIVPQWESFWSLLVYFHLNYIQEIVN